MTTTSEVCKIHDRAEPLPATVGLVIGGIAAFVMAIGYCVARWVL